MFEIHTIWTKHQRQSLRFEDFQSLKLIFYSTSSPSCRFSNVKEIVRFANKKEIKQSYDSKKKIKLNGLL